MSDRALLLAVLLSVPLFSLGAGYLIKSSYEAKWRAAVLRQYSDVDRKQLDAMPLSRYCREVPESRELPVCGWYPLVQSMVWGSVIAIALGLGLLVGIYLMGRLSCGNRNRLVLVFKPGLYVTLSMLVLLSVLHSGLFIAAITLGQIATVGYVAVFGMFLVFGVGLGAAICVIFLARAMLLMVRIPPTPVIGRAVSEQRSPALWRYIRNLASSAQALPPQSIVVGFETNFFVIDAKIKCFTGMITGRTLYISLPLCRILTESELRAIVGHELGHFKGDDTKFSRQFAPIYRGALEALSSLQGGRSAGISSVGLMPAISVLSYFFECFAATANQIGRVRELAADAFGAQLSSKQAMASALVKVSAFAHLWEDALQRMRNSLNEQKTVTNLSSIFGDYVAEVSDASRLLGLDDECLAHPMDSHPPLKVRLESIGVTMEAIQSSALVTTPAQPAVSIIDHYQEIEEELTGMERRLMETAGEVSQNAQLRCPACGKFTPASAASCGCGFRFGRAM